MDALDIQLANGAGKHPARNVIGVTAAVAQVRWSADRWQAMHDMETQPSGLPGLYFADLPIAAASSGTTVEWTFRWLEAGRWEGRNFQVEIV